MNGDLDIMSAEDSPGLRVEIRFKNARLYNAIVEQTTYTSGYFKSPDKSCGPVSAFCVQHGLKSGARDMIYKLLNLKIGPILKIGVLGRVKIRPLCLTLSDLLGHPVEWLFPDDLYSVKWPTLTTDVVASHMVRLIDAPRSALMLPPVQEDNIIAAELTRDIHNVLRTLTPREAKILTARFGLNGDEPQTLNEVGKHEAITRDRVRQIEAKALRHLRHPSRARVLRPYITNAYWTTDNTTQPDAQARPIESHAVEQVAHVSTTRVAVTTSSQDHIGNNIEQWAADCQVSPSDLRSLTWSCDNLSLAPTDAFEPLITRVLVWTTPPHNSAGIHIRVQGTAVRSEHRTMLKSRRPTAKR